MPATAQRPAPSGLGNYQVDTDIIRLGDKVYFGGCNPFLGADSCTSLYVSDGTVEGTGFFFDLVPGGLSLSIDDMVAGDSLFYFAGHTINEGYELLMAQQRHHCRNLDDR
ncbi:MAG: hypothetical protein R3B47_14810 [Bacteroidia bacterium]